MCLVAQMWAQVGQVAIDNAPNLAFAFPAEGLSRSMPTTPSFLRESYKHQDLAATTFINYLLRPEVAAKIAHGNAHGHRQRSAARALLPQLRSVRTTVLYPLPRTCSLAANGSKPFQALPSACVIVIGRKSKRPEIQLPCPRSR